MDYAIALGLPTTSLDARYVYVNKFINVTSIKVEI